MGWGSGCCAISGPPISSVSNQVDATVRRKPIKFSHFRLVRSGAAVSDRDSG
jgi:hypothetical protein